MTKRLLSTLLFLAVIGLVWTATLSEVLSVQPSSETGNYEFRYAFAVQNGYYRSDHILHVSFPPSLKAYYSSKSHTINNEKDYARFVTPKTVQSIADNIRNITRNTPYDDEEFANAVLTIVRQIPYVRSSAKYPVETLVDNWADCDGLSILAASIMKAGGLDVVLLLYRGVTPPHMNVGVYLEHMPVSRTWWMTPSGVEYGNKTYWIAETTSLADWTVGDRPELLSRDKPQVIPLDNSEKKSPASISSSLHDRMQLSSISINLSPDYSDISGRERALNISGSIFPAFPNQSVTLYVNQPGYSPTAHNTTTNQFGNYSISWNATFYGTYRILASWSGFSNYSGSDSETLTVFVGTQQPPIGELPQYFWGLTRDAEPRGYSSSYLSLLNQGAKDFLKSNLTGTDVILSGEFMVLSNGRELTPEDTVMTIPAYERTYRLPRSRQTVRILVPEETVVIPGSERLSGQFGFILKRTDENNYTARVKILTSTDVSQIAQNFDRNNVMLMNATTIVTKNAWHKAVAKVSGDELTVEVYNENGTRLDKIATTTVTDVGELGIITTYQTSQVLAFKNLKVEAITQDTVPNAANQAQENRIDFFYPYIRISLLIAGAALAVVCLKERKDNSKRLDKQTNER